MIKNNNKIIGFDVGDQWIGVAHANEFIGIVFPYQTWQAYEFVKKFTAYLKEYQVQTVVVGFPLTLKGSESQQTEKVKNWVEVMSVRFSGVTFVFQDERLSSKFATNISIQNNSKNKHSNHELAAALILDNYMKKNKKSFRE